MQSLGKSVLICHLQICHIDLFFLVFGMIFKSTIKWLFICILDKITDVLIRVCFMLVLINGTIS